jgi:FkbM family methyltransferase
MSNINSNQNKIGILSMRLQLEAALKNQDKKITCANISSFPLILLGSGSLYAKPFLEFCLSKLNVIACVDNLNIGKRLGSHIVVGDDALPDLLSHFPDAVGVLCCQSDGAVAHFFRVWGDHRLLVNMFQVMRDCDANLDAGYYLNFQDKNEIAKIYEDCLEYFHDFESQRSLLAVLLFRTTLVQNWLEEVRLPYDDMYFFTSGLAVSKDEVFVDAGSFDGDSISQFLRRTESAYKYIYALEPDPSSFESLKRNLSSLPSCSLHKIGLWNEKTTASFQVGGLGSHLGKSDLTVQLTSLDEMEIGPISLLKMDIEGAEIAALQGAVKTIEKYKPKLAIAAYHKADDIPNIINCISAIRSDYTFTIRHHSPFFRDTVIMAF